MYNKLSRPARLAAIAVGPVAAFAIACGGGGDTLSITETTTATPALPFSGATHAEFITAINTDSAGQTSILNDWLRSHPANSITSLTSVFGQRNQIYGFEAVITDRPNKGEACQYLDNNDMISTPNPRAYGATAIQQFIESHAGSEVITVGVPSYHSDNDMGGIGNRGYIACALPK